MVFKITREVCAEILQKKLPNQKFELVKYTVINIAEKLGFLGEYQRLALDVKVSDREETFHLFVKMVPQTGFSDYVLTSGSFQNERFMFETVFSKMVDLGIDIHDCVPQCFYARENEVIILEDLSYEGFQVANKHGPFGLEEMEILIKKLAKFHGSSLVLEEKLSRNGYSFRIDREFGGCLKETNYIKQEKHLGYIAIQSSIKGLYKMLDRFPPNGSPLPNDEIKEMIKDFYDGPIYEQSCPSKKYRNVFCHGDLWATNTMLRAAGAQHVDDCRLVDFQNTRICPPAHDLLSFIYLTTTRAFRQEHLQNILLLYHQELVSTLQKHDCPPVITLKEFLDSCEEYKIFAINFAATMFPIVMLNASEMEKFFQDKELTEHVMFVDRGDFILEVCDRDHRYKDLLEESVKDLRTLCEDLKNSSKNVP